MIEEIDRGERGGGIVHCLTLLIYIVTLDMLSTYFAINDARAINKVWIGDGSVFDLTCVIAREEVN